MSVKTCPGCGVQFTGESKYCRAECYYQARRGWEPGNKVGLVVNCAVCGKSFAAAPSTNRRYCSRECYAQGHSATMTGRFRKRVTKVCDHCGQQYEIIPSWAASSRYCSRECKHAHARTVRGDDHPLKREYPAITCEFCGATFHVKPSIAHKARFCSRQCHGAWTARHISSPTSIEIAVAAMLDELTIAYEAQKQMGTFLCDFVIKSHRLVIECDGDYWHSTETQKAKDRRKDSWLASHGYAVIRLTERAILADPAGCQHLIATVVQRQAGSNICNVGELAAH